MWHAIEVPKMIQIRNVPDWLHREIERRARAHGMTMTAYLQQLLEREVATPDQDEVFARVASHEPVDLGRPAAELIHEERAARTK
jgi:plasmid stability protein